MSTLFSSITINFDSGDNKCLSQGDADFYDYIRGILASVDAPIGNNRVHLDPNDLPGTNAVKKAGRSFRKNEGDLKDAGETIRKHRMAHSVPLATITKLINWRCRKLGVANVQSVQRLKRYETIIDKLQRDSLDGKTPNRTCISNMSDIGGCRFIFPDMDSLNCVREWLLEVKDSNNAGCRVGIKHVNDYILNPKDNDCGYRSLHVICCYTYKGTSRRYLVEAQLRTQLQHLWATTVEIVDIIEGLKIKTHSHSISKKSSCQLKWEEILSIVSHQISHKEGVACISDEECLDNAKRLEQLDRDINAIHKLHSFEIVSEAIIKEKLINEVEYALLVVDIKKRDLIGIQGFDNYGDAISKYDDIERLVSFMPSINVLLVSTERMRDLKGAYPNYLGDCLSFVNLMNEIMTVK
ncbi:RelA/SpoT domain-containing protein [Photobacterium damselae]|uniref:RelA/SpoT domain-containing protein n=1 Tax=Photobacterium damselae TaxID=38293 RepID=UPI004068DBAE